MKLFTALVVFALLVGSGHAQVFGYGNFAGATGLSLNGAAFIDQTSGVLMVTPNAIAQSGRAWASAPVYVAFGFDTVFQFKVTRTGVGADGMAFVIQNSAAGNAAASVGGTGSDNGYGGSPGISNALAIELDMYYMSSSPYFDTSGNEISIHTMGNAAINAYESSSIGRVTPVIPMNDQLLHTLRVNYVPGTLSVYLDDMLNPVLVTPYDFAPGGTYVNTGTPAPGLSVPNGVAWVGFTGGTGGLSQSHEIHNWTWTSTNAPITCYSGNVGAATLPYPAQVLKVNGSSGGLQHIVNTTVSSNITVSFDPFPGGAIQPFVIWGIVAPAGSLVPLFTPYGDLCFIPQFLDPFNPFNFTLTDCIGLGMPGFIPSAPGLWSFTMPGGIAVPLTLTLQGALIDIGTPAITNSVTINVVPAPAPVITVLSPLYGNAGATVTMTGTGFLPGATVRFGGVLATISAQSATQIVTAVPTGVPCPGTLLLTNPDGQTATRNFNTPLISGLLPSSGLASGGANLYILGSGLAPGCTVTIGGAPATITTNIPTQIICITPPGTVGPAALVVTTPQGCSASSTYTYN
ncbi:MAG: hypothetical protein EXS14_05695 [Planctomycetes bacterium]|nr:hypothetical protein [Planctomycetota bacterium]